MSPFQKATQELLGKPWDSQKYHCYDFVCEAYFSATNKKLPTYFANGSNMWLNSKTIREDSTDRIWQKIAPDMKQPGDLVLMGSERIAYHIGMYTHSEYQIGYIAHCSEKCSGVVNMSITDLARYRWTVHTYLRYKGH